MSKKNKPDARGFVFSTDPSFRFEEEDQPVAQTLTADRQKLRIRLDTKQRAGKSSYISDRFYRQEEDIETLGKQLKNFCGTGGSVKTEKPLYRVINAIKFCNGF